MKFLQMKALAFARCAAALLRAARDGAVFRPLGPEGGDVLSFGADPGNPRHVFSGTADGHIFASEDGGEHWELRGRRGARLDSIVTAILVDPRAENYYASTWTRDAAAGGACFAAAMADERGLRRGLRARLCARWPSRAGARRGTGRDAGGRSARRRVPLAHAGATWEQISPVATRNCATSIRCGGPGQRGHHLRGHISFAVETTDGGLHWSSIHAGMIDDSDVMSLLADRAQAGRVYASACSGIYRSDNGGEIWQKVQGIPYTARRTVGNLQGPGEAGDRFRGDTEGLWKTADAGSTWDRITPADWSVTAMVVAAGAPDRVLIAWSSAA